MFYKKENDPGKSSDQEVGDIDREDYYKDFEILELSVNASPEDVADAYMRLKEAYSPDLVSMSSPVKDEIEKKRRLDMIAKIEAAYRSLQRLFEKQGESSARKALIPDQEDDRGQEQEENQDQEKETGSSQWPRYLPLEDEASEAGSEETPEVNSPSPSDETESMTDSQDRPQADIADFSGHTLKEIRERLNMTLDQIYQETKIRIPTLENLENENFADLPPEVYVKGFVKSYALCLSLDPIATVKTYMEKFGDWRRGGTGKRRHGHAPFRFSKKKEEAAL